MVDNGRPLRLHALLNGDHLRGLADGGGKEGSDLELQLLQPLLCRGPVFALGRALNDGETFLERCLSGRKCPRCLLGRRLGLFGSDLLCSRCRFVLRVRSLLDPPCFQGIADHGARNQEDDGDDQRRKPPKKCSGVHQ